MIGSAITYFILAISGLIGSGIAIEEINKAKHSTRAQQPKSAETRQVK